MASGRPDFHPTMLLEGKYGTTLVPVLVDATGQMYIVMTGQNIQINNLPSDYFKASQNIGGSDANLTVDQSAKDRDSYGLDGATRRQIAVDAAGIILARLKGAYGATLKDISVDADGVMLARLKGNYADALQDVKLDAQGNLLAKLVGLAGSTPIELAADVQGHLLAKMMGLYGATPLEITVDAAGNMLAVMKGDYSGALKTIAVDTNGIMKANLSVQDLNFLTVRPAYGSAKRVAGVAAAFPGSAWKELLNVSGRGVILSAYMQFEGTTSFHNAYARVTLDGVTSDSMALASLLALNLLEAESSLFFIKRYDDSVLAFLLGVRAGITFESTCVIAAYNNDASAYTISYEIVYALTP